MGCFACVGRGCRLRGRCGSTVAGGQHPVSENAASLAIKRKLLLPILGEVGERLNGEVAKLTSQLRQKEAELEAANERIKEQEEQIAELNDNINGLNEELAVCNEKVKELEQTIRDLKGKNPNVIQSVAALEEGVLTPGDKGKVVATSEEWKYAIVEFSPEFMAELIGPQRDRALPQSEVMARRAGVENIDEAFVTRMKLRQAIRDKNLVIVDILTDWQQKPVKVGDIVFY